MVRAHISRGSGDGQNGRTSANHAAWLSRESHANSNGVAVTFAHLCTIRFEYRNRSHPCDFYHFPMTQGFCRCLVQPRPINFGSKSFTKWGKFGLEIKWWNIIILNRTHLPILRTLTHLYFQNMPMPGLTLDRKIRMSKNHPAIKPKTDSTIILLMHFHYLKRP
jgi:hypothetical protein